MAGLLSTTVGGTKQQQPFGQLGDDDTDQNAIDYLNGTATPGQQSLNAPVGGPASIGDRAAQANVTTFNPVTRSVNAPTETVSGQLNTLLSGPESPYITRARARADETSNARGLLNSSIGAGAGEAAAIDAALPIASADANIYGNVSGANMAAQNTALALNAGESNTTARGNAAASNALIGQEVAGEQQRETLGTQTEAQSRLQAEQGAQTRETQAAGGEIQSQLATQQAAAAQAQSRVQGEIQQGLITSQEQADARLKELTGQIQSGLSAQESQQASALSTQQAGQQTQLQQQQIEGQKQLAQMSADLQTQLQQLRGDQAQQLAGIESQWRTLIQASAGASSLYQNTLHDMAAIMADTNTSTEQKQAGIDKMTQGLQNGLTIIGGIANLDLAGLLDFGTTGAQPAPAP